MQTKFITYLLSFIFFTGTCIAQTGVLSGKITDASTGQVFTGATITVLKSARKTVTSKDCWNYAIRSRFRPHLPLPHPQKHDIVSA